MSDKRIAYLSILWWGVSLGGQHYSANIAGEDKDGKYLSVELTHPLSQKEAILLNKKDGARSFCLHRPKDESDRFLTEKDLIRCALKKYKSLIPNANILIKGSAAVCNPQQVLDGPEPFKSRANALWLEQEQIGGYEGSPVRTREILWEYIDLLKSLDS